MIALRQIAVSVSVASGAACLNYGAGKYRERVNVCARAFAHSKLKAHKENRAVLVGKECYCTCVPIMPPRKWGFYQPNEFISCVGAINCDRWACIHSSSYSVLSWRLHYSLFIYSFLVCFSWAYLTPPLRRVGFHTGFIRILHFVFPLREKCFWTLLTWFL